MHKIIKHLNGSNTFNSTMSSEAKKIVIESPNYDSPQESSDFSDTSNSSDSSSSSPSVEMTDAEKRNKRREEFREAAQVREKAIQMQKKAEEQMRQTKDFVSLMSQAREDPRVLAKALNMSEDEFNRKIFNKAYQIKEEPVKPKEETPEEKINRLQAQYEQDREEERLRREEERKRADQASFEKVKHDYITEHILPAINDSHEFIHRNDKYSMAAFAYDFMNSAYQKAIEEKKEFTLKAEDVINQIEEELEKNAAETIQEARKVSKLKKYFNEEDSISRKDFNSSVTVSKRSESPTLSNSLGASAPPSLASSLSSRPLEKRISLRNREARLKAAQRNLGA